MVCPWCDGTGWRLLSHGGPVRCAHELHSLEKINLSQQNQAVTSPERPAFAHLSSETPDVKSGKTRVSSFNGALETAGSAKSADPVCYNVCVGGNSAAALFDIERTP